MTRTLTITLAALILSCQTSSQGKKAPVGDTDATSKADSSGEAQPAKPEPEPEPEPDDGPGPLPAPGAYFGDLGFRRIEEPNIPTPGKKSSVILLVADALNAKHLGIYGYERPTSKNIDALARGGVLYTNYISNSSWTRPSFTTIMTGLPKKEHHVELEGPGVVDSIKTLAERFQKAGYVTYGISGNPLIREFWGYNQGFRYWHDIKTLGTKGFPPDQVLTRPVLDWISSLEDEPFFLTIFLTAPHPPYRPLPQWRKFLKTVPRGDVNEHPFKEYESPLPKDEHSRIVAAYDDEVRYMDAMIGTLLKALKKKGRRKDTSIIFTADHGEMFGQHGCYLHSYHMYEQTLHVPMIINSPRISARKIYDDRPFTHIDVAPTALDLAGIPVPGDLPGKSMLAAMAAPEEHRERILFSQYNAHGVRRQAIRKGKFKLVHHHKVEQRAAEDLNELHPSLNNLPDPRSLPSLAWDGEKWEYFDLAKDPQENENIYEESRNTPRLHELVAALAEWADIEIDTPGEISEDLLEALEAAGYIQRDDKEEEGRLVDVVKSDVRVRISPVDGSVVDKIGKGEKVKYFKKDKPEKEGWCRVVTPKKLDGYVICAALDLK